VTRDATPTDGRPEGSALRRFLKRVLPAPLLRWRQRRVVARIRAEYAKKSVKEAFAAIYQDNRWGGQKGDLCSGVGSVEAFAVAYAARVNAFINTHGIASLVDLGCGDFRVGRRLARPGLDYTGVDVVDAVVRRNQELYGSDSIRFVCRDATAEALPPAGLCLIRQVLQHLSNAEIAAVLRNCGQYPYVLITEHVPAGPVRQPNLDKPHGPDIRLLDGSGVFLELPPFGLPVTPLFETEHGGNLGGVLRTVLLVNRAGSAVPVT
jgi:hypothetical protein